MGAPVLPDSFGQFRWWEPRLTAPLCGLALLPGFMILWQFSGVS